MRSYLNSLIIRRLFLFLTFSAGLIGTAWAALPDSSDCRGFDLAKSQDVRVVRSSGNTNDLISGESVHFHSQDVYFKTGKVIAYGNRILAEVEYMLNRYPNHLEVLARLDQVTLLLKNDRVPSGKTADCFFRTSIRFVPDDMGVKALYGIYLLKRNRTDAAIAMFKEIEDKHPENANNHYNLGFAYLSAKKPELARQQAIQAYAGGFPLPGLKERLRRMGLWGVAEEAAVKAEAESAAAERGQQTTQGNERDMGGTK